MSLLTERCSLVFVWFWIKAYNLHIFYFNSPVSLLSIQEVYGTRVLFGMSSKWIEFLAPECGIHSYFIPWTFISYLSFGVFSSQISQGKGGRHRTWRGGVFIREEQHRESQVRKEPGSCDWGKVYCRQFFLSPDAELDKMFWILESKSFGNSRVYERINS